MFKNHLLVVFRNLRRNRLFSGINLIGLSVGMASVLIIGLWIQHEKGYDQFEKDSDRLYMMMNLDLKRPVPLAWSSTPKILGPTLKKDFPEVEDAARFRNAKFLLSTGDKRLNLLGNFADSGFLSIVQLPMKTGNPKTALAKDHSIVITESVAKSLFGNENALGKIITVNNDNENQCEVTGVLKDLPDNSSFHFSYLMSWTQMKNFGWDDDEEWANNSVQTFVQLKAGASPADFNKRIRNIKAEHTRNSQFKLTELMFAHPARDWHLRTAWKDGSMSGGLIETVNYLTLIAGCILLIACINFMNLSTARSEKRAKEVGIRKVVGAPKRYLVAQFLGESVLIALMAGILAIVLVEFALPAFNLLTQKQLRIDFQNPVVWIYGPGFIILTGLIAGSYPAFYLSSFKPSSVLKGTFKNVNALLTPRKVLVVLQFGFAILLIISTITIRRQVIYAQNRNPGYDKEQLAYVFMQGDIPDRYEVIRSELLSQRAALAVNRSSGPMTDLYADSWGFSWAGSTESDKRTDFWFLSADADFTGTMGVKLAAGREIDIRKFLTDSTAIVLNETAVKTMRLKNPVGAIVNQNARRYHVVGVIKDFIMGSPYEPVAPMIIRSVQDLFTINIRLNPDHKMSDNVATAEKIFKKYNPDYPFELHFMDESYAEKFESEQLTAKLVTLFAVLTIFISCLGLLGLSVYTTENRVKEIGVRKVLGASVSGIAALLSGDFMKLVLIAFLISAPVAAMVMKQWLNAFPYRVGLDWWIFALAAVISMLIALLTIGFLSVKAAMANPTESLRSE